MKRVMEPIKEGYIRITDVLSKFSGLDKIDPEVLRNAADRGTRVHQYCDAIIEGLGLFSIEDDCKGYIDSFNQWNVGKNYLTKPPRFYDDEFMITGECDAIYKQDGKLILVDFKTPVAESKTWPLQGSAYAYMAKKLGYNIEYIEFVKLSKVGKPPKVYTYTENFDLFLSCLDVYRYFYKLPTDQDLQLYYI